MFGCLYRHTFNHTGCVTRDAIIYVRPQRFKCRSVTPWTRQPSRKRSASDTAWPDLLTTLHLYTQRQASFSCWSHYWPWLPLVWTSYKTTHATALNSLQYFRINTKLGNIAKRTGFPPLSFSSRRLVWLEHLPFHFLPTPLRAHTIWRRYIIKTFHIILRSQQKNLPLLWEKSCMHPECHLRRLDH